MDCCGNKTSSTLFVKGIDYLSEEYVKQLMQDTSVKKLEAIKPFVDSIAYPSRFFPDYRANVPLDQFRDSVFVGFMDMLVLDLESDPREDEKLAYTLLTFNLDGIERQFVTVSGGTGLITIPVSDMPDIEIPFSSFVSQMFPLVNREFPFNPHAIHVLKDVVIESKTYDPEEDEFSVSYATPQTRDFTFCITVSGYSLLMQ